MLTHQLCTALCPKTWHGMGVNPGLAGKLNTSPPFKSACLVVKLRWSSKGTGYTFVDCRDTTVKSEFS